MSPALADFLFEAANFLLLAAGLGWLLFRPVRGALDRERQRQARSDEEQQRLRAEAEELLEAARSAREDAEREGQARRREILAAAREEAERILAQARESEATERRAFERELDARRAGEASALAGTVARIAGESVIRLLASLPGPDLDAALTRVACDELRALSPADRAAALVESARPLDADARSLLEDAIGGRFEPRVVDGLGAGVRVTTPAGQIDATALSIARQATRAMTTAGGNATACSAGDSDD